MAPKVAAAKNTHGLCESGSGSGKRKRKRREESEDCEGPKHQKNSSEVRPRKEDSGAWWNPDYYREDHMYFTINTGSEKRIAAYPGHEDVAASRRFSLSRYFLVCLLEYVGAASNLVWKFWPMALIRDKFFSPGWKEVFPLDQPDKYRHESFEDSHREARLAHLLIIMVDWLGKLGERATVDEATQKSVLRKLYEMHEWCDGAPEVSGEIELAKFTCTLDPEETRHGPYNRAWVLLDHFCCHASAENSFAGRFKTRSWDTSAAIKYTNVPAWMRKKGSVPSPPPIPAVEAYNYYAKFTRPTEVYWERENVPAESGTELDAYLVGHYIENPLPRRLQRCDPDPRMRDAEQFRDYIRRQYHCQEMELPLPADSLEISPAKSVPGTLSFDAFTCDSQALRRTLRARFEDRRHGSKVMVRVQLRLLDLQNGKPLYESKESRHRSLPNCSSGRAQKV